MISLLRGVPAGAIALIFASALGGPPRVASAAETVRVLYADSMTPVFERSIVPDLAARGVTLFGEGRGSVANANLILGGLKKPDVFIAADRAVMQPLLAGGLATWAATFATTRLVLAYSPRSPHAAEFRTAGAGKARWYDVLAEPGVRFARTDPAQDPRGYRVIEALELADDFYHRPLRARLLGDDRNPSQILSDDAILLRLEQGELDAAILYETQARVRDLPYIALPPEIDLGDPAFAAFYARASVTINGITRVGAPIAFALTIPAVTDNPAGAVRFVRYLLEGAGRKVLAGSGFRMQRLAFDGNRAAVPREILELR